MTAFAPIPTGPDPILFAGLAFRGLSKDILFQQSAALKLIVTVNAELIVIANESERLRTIINGNYATFDGQIPYLIARARNRGRRFEKISGSDLIYDVCRLAGERSLRVFLLGGRASSNRAAVDILRQRFAISIEGHSPDHRPYPFDAPHDSSIMDRITAFRPHVLLVGFGAPKQEYWIDDHRLSLERLGVKWAVGMGGTFEFVAGEEKRAPVWVQRMGLETPYRLCQNPSRFKRFLRFFRFFRYI